MPCNIHSITLFDKIESTFVSENACLITWPEQICPQQHQHIIQCQTHLQKSLSEHLIDVVAAYNSLMIYYDFTAMPMPTLQDEVALAITQTYPSKQNSNTDKPTLTTSAIIEIPVYYGTEVAWDLNSVAEQLNLSPSAVISLHTQQFYQAYALGFTPGFCYLGSLAPQLQLPRRATPRYKIPAGAVAIAEAQTAVYPNESPGGWHIIGRTPQPMYRIDDDKFIPTIRVGAQVKFTAITHEEFTLLQQQDDQKVSARHARS